MTLRALRAVPLLAACLAATAAGCSDEMSDPAEAEIGTGLTGWEPVAEGEELVLVMGPQGGYHFSVNARIRGLEPGDPAIAGAEGNPRTRFAAFLEPEGRQVNIVLPPEELGYVESADASGWYEIPAPTVRLLMIENDEVSGIYGQRVRIELTVTDAAGRTATDTRTVVASM